MDKYKILANALKPGETYIVGGYVRDKLMGLNPLDVDLCVTGLDEQEFCHILTQRGYTFKSISPDGKAPVYGVWLGEWVEVALARREKLVNGELVLIADKNLTIEEDLKRRDFTINGMAIHLLTDTLIDSWGGQADIENRILRHISDHFNESEDRPIRLAVFSARLPEFTIAPATIGICQAMRPMFNKVSFELRWKHMSKAFKGAKPSNFIRTLKEIGWLVPPLENIVGLKQDARYHPEGDVFEHTCFTMDAAAQIATRKGQDRIIAVLAALCHDLGKYGTTEIHADGSITSYGHPDNLAPVIEFFDLMGVFEIATRNKVLELTKLHMCHVGVTPSRRMVRRLASKLKHITIDELATLIEADHSGRPPLDPVMPAAMQEILKAWQELPNMSENGIEGLIKGRHLLEMGVKPGKEMGNIIRAALEAQIAGEFDTLAEGIKWVQNEL